MIPKFAFTGAAILLSVCLLTACNDSAERRVETGLDSLGDKAGRWKDSAGAKLERLGDSLGPKLEAGIDTLGRKGKVLKERLENRLDRDDTTKP